MLSDPPPGSYSWTCLICEAWGYGGSAGYEKHYRQHYEDPAEFRSFLTEARQEHGMSGMDAWDWALAAYLEYKENQM